MEDESWMTMASRAIGKKKIAQAINPQKIASALPARTR